MFRTALSAAALAALPALAQAAPVFEATPTDPGGAFDITIAPGSSLPGSSAPFVGSVFGGAGFAISGVENFSGRLAGGGYMTSLRFEIYEPTTTQTLEGCNTACVDSTFSLELFDGTTSLVSFTFFPTDDAITGVEVADGFYTFDSFVVTETVGTNDNEFFANFSANTASVIPLPAGGLLLASALAALGLRRRRGV